MQRFAYVVVMVIALLAPAAAQNLEVELQRAVQRETASGDLKSAVEEYRRIADRAADRDRPVAAQALLRLAEAYEQLGHVEAQRVLERVLRNYPDQPQIVAQARQRLEALKTPLAQTPQITARQITVVHRMVAGLRPAPDGRLTATDWTNGDLVLIDPVSGSMTRLVAGTFQDAKPTWGENALFSSDMSRIVYSWWDDRVAGTSHQLRIMDGKPLAPSRALIDGTGPYRNPYALAWSRDGRSILMSREVVAPTDPSRPAGRGDFEVAWLTIDDASLKPLATLPWWAARGNTVDAHLSPDGRFVAYSTQTGRESADRSIMIIPASGGTAVEIVSGGTNEQPVWLPDGTGLVFASTRGGTAGLWSMGVRDGQADGSPQLLKREAGRLHLAGFTRTGALYYTAQTSIEQIAIVEMDAPGGRAAGGTQQVAASFPGTMPAWSPDGRWVAYKRSRGDAAGVYDLVLRAAASGDEKVYSSKLRMGALRPVWHGSSLVQPIAHQKIRIRVTESALVEELALHDLPAGALSPDGKTMFVPEKGQLSALEIDTGARRSITVPDGVGQVAVSPDGRRLAILRFNPESEHSSVSRIGVDGSDFRRLFVGSERRLTVRGVSWTRDGAAIVFGMSDDGRTWRIMRLPADGGTPEFTGVEVEEMRSFDLSPDGTRLAYSTTEFRWETWAASLASTGR